MIDCSINKSIDNRKINFFCSNKKGKKIKLMMNMSFTKTLVERRILHLKYPFNSGVSGAISDLNV